MHTRLVTATIDLQKYTKNLQVIREKIPSNTAIMAVLKANAYGHGAVELAKAAVGFGVQYIGVVSISEAVQLREHGITVPIMLINYLDPDSFIEAVNNDLTITVMGIDAIKALSSIALKHNKKVKVHLKIDTGMHRAGCDSEETVELAREILKHEDLVFEGIFTHFATADDNDLTFARKQLSVFNEQLEKLNENSIDLPPLIHAANSAAILALPESHFTMVRPGISSFGLSPFSEDHSQYQDFYQQSHPILELKTQLIHIREIGKGEGVGYGRTFIAKEKMKVGLLPLGYGDGLRRAPQRSQFVLLNGHRVPIIGRVSMDQTCIDITNIPNIRRGDEVVIIGAQGKEMITVDDVAKEWGTINYEVVTSLSNRVERVYNK